jgi:hypothetical protein
LKLDTFISHISFCWINGKSIDECFKPVYFPITMRIFTQILKNFTLIKKPLHIPNLDLIFTAFLENFNNDYESITLISLCSLQIIKNSCNLSKSLQLAVHIYNLNLSDLEPCTKVQIFHHISSNRLTDITTTNDLLNVDILYNVGFIAETLLLTSISINIYKLCLKLTRNDIRNNNYSIISNLESKLIDLKQYTYNDFETQW